MNQQQMNLLQMNQGLYRYPASGQPTFGNIAPTPANWNQPTAMGGQFENGVASIPAPQVPLNLYANNQPNAGYNVNNTPATYQRVPCRVIGNPTEILPAEVPMDGSIALFLQQDLSCAYAKQWGSSGNIDTVKFVPVFDEDPAQQAADSITLPELLDHINNQFEELRNLIAVSGSGNKQNFNKQKPQRDPKKQEGNENA